MATETADFLRRPTAPRRRSARRALAVIPVAGYTVSPGETVATEVNAMDNFLNSRQGVDSCSPVPSPDELVIQKRGRRRKTIVWSPDLDSHKRNSLLSLSSTERTPVKSPTKSPMKSPSKSTMVLRNTPRKRLALGDTESQFSTPDTKKRSSHYQSSLDKCSSQSHFSGNLVSGLKGLSREQLVDLIMDLVSMQDEGSLHEDTNLRSVLLKKMPMADIRPLKEELSNLRQNVYASLVSSNSDDSAYSRAYIHLDAFQKTLTDQGRTLCESQHWMSVMEYVFAAWSITKELPEWKDKGADNITQKCFKNLAQFSAQALREGNFKESLLEVYAQKLEAMVEDCAQVKLCLRLLKDAK